ncbi:MUC1-extracellular alpha-1 4-glucan glucosidase, partial [Fusarium pseudoanthophilum]
METQAVTSTAKSSSTTSHGISQTPSASSISTYVYVNPASETLPASGSTIKAPYPTGYTIRTVYQTTTEGITCSKTIFAETVTTATYLTVGPSHSALVTTCVPVTLLYSPCYCDHDVYPSVALTTIVFTCSACGTKGENTVTLTVPEAA